MAMMRGVMVRVTVAEGMSVTMRRQHRLGRRVMLVRTKFLRERGRIAVIGIAMVGTAMSGDVRGSMSEGTVGRCTTISAAMSRWSEGVRRSGTDV